MLTCHKTIYISIQQTAPCCDNFWQHSLKMLMYLPKRNIWGSIPVYTLFEKDITCTCARTHKHTLFSEIYIKEEL